MKNKNINYGLLTDTHVLAPEIRQNFNEHFEVKDASFARGRFAQVRRCVHKMTNSECAAKVMRKYRRAVDVSGEILHEVRVLLMADKERHIVNLLQLYESTSEFILVLEMAAGGELQRVLDDYDSIPEANTKIILRQLLNAVIFLHSKSIAHLDIKPQNILLTAPYPVGEVKLCDFGISRLIKNDTELREIIGTADYVAPEILHYEPIFLTTDCWSIGILVYAMLTGYTPFGGETKQETYSNITHGALDFPEDLFSNISESAIDFICKLLKKKPKQRLNSNKCLEHEWLVFDEQPVNQKSINNELKINENISNNSLSNRSFNNNVENKEPVQPDQSINNQESSINVENHNLNNSFNKVTNDDQINKGQNLKNSEQNGQKNVLIGNKTDINCTGKCESINESTMNGNCKEELAVDCKLIDHKNENQLNKSIKEDKLNLDNSINNLQNSNQQPEKIINSNTISTANTANELIATCTNVTLLTAN